MSAEEERTKENATVLARVGTAVFPAEGLAPWMSDYPARTQAAIVGIKTIADIGEELERQVWMLKNPKEEASPKAENEEEEPEEELFDTSDLHGAAYILGYGLNRLAINMHNYAPSVDGKRTRQAIALGKATNPGIAAQPGDEKKRSIFERITGRGKNKEGA